jgi:hypothetical protein
VNRHVDAERHAAGKAASLAIVISPLIALMKDQFHHRTRADLEDSDPPRRTARAASAFACPRPAYRLGQLVQLHDERDVFQTSPDELPAIDINSL